MGGKKGWKDRTRESIEWKGGVVGELQGRGVK